MQNSEINMVSVFVNCLQTDPDILDKENPFDLVSDQLDIHVCRVPLFDDYSEGLKAKQAIFAVGSKDAFDLYRRAAKSSGNYTPYFLRQSDPVT